MHALTIRTTRTTRTTSTLRTARSAPNSPAAGSTRCHRPNVRTRPAIAPPACWGTTQQATHYFDAPAQSAMTLRTVLHAYREPGHTLGRVPDEALMVSAVNTLVASSCPQGGQDSESHAYFGLLLNMHLSGLEPEELKSLARALKSSGYDGVSGKAAAQEDIYDEFGFATGQPEDRAVLPSDWHHLLDEAIDHAAAIARRPLPGSAPGEAECRAARQCLVDAALHWPAGTQSVTDLVAIAAQLSDVLGLQAPTLGDAVKATPRGSLVDWRGTALLIDAAAVTALAGDADGKLLGELLRDLTELLVTRRMFGARAHPSRLCSADRTRMQKVLDGIVSALPAAPEPALRAAAARVLANTGVMGKVQVLPTVGIALGHAWIGSQLSVLPDKTQPPTNIGTRYMHPGFRLEPDDCEVRQWPMRWLNEKENAALFQDEHAWHVSVPVERERLKQAATDVAQQWKDEALPYRFTGTAPGMRSQGCRASVLQAIVQGMDDDARTLFAYFNAGLAEPESPTELALRMNRFMQWLEIVGTDH